MTRVSEAVADLIVALCDEAGVIAGSYYREHMSWQLETTAGAVADLLVTIHPELDRLHNLELNEVPRMRV